MPLPRTLLEGHLRFRRDEHARNRGRYLQLAELGQAPTAMVIACCDARVDVSAIFDAEAGAVCIQVRDEGRGMPPAVLERVKDPFFTTRLDQGGTGLGLFISNGIVEDMGGSLSFESAEGQGTVACVRLSAAGREKNAEKLCKRSREAAGEEPTR